MIMIASLMYLGTFQIIFRKIIGPLSVVTKNPLLKCTEGMLKRILSKRPTIQVLNFLLLPVIPQLFLKNQQKYFSFNSCHFALYRTVQKSLEQVKDLPFWRPNWAQNGLFPPKLELFFRKSKSICLFCLLVSFIAQNMKKIVRVFLEKIKTLRNFTTNLLLALLEKLLAPWCSDYHNFIQQSLNSGSAQRVGNSRW